MHEKSLPRWPRPTPCTIARSLMPDRAGVLGDRQLPRSAPRSAWVITDSRIRTARRGRGAGRRARRGVDCSLGQRFEIDPVEEALHALDGVDAVPGRRDGVLAERELVEQQRSVPADPPHGEQELERLDQVVRADGQVVVPLQAVVVELDADQPPAPVDQLRAPPPATPWRTGSGRSRGRCRGWRRRSRRSPAASSQQSPAACGPAAP